ncbi:MAG TPA: potassium channel family protein [Anaerolineales bacterium]|nr:potassium channel family protein [Anaerolineales bacterium]
MMSLTYDQEQALQTLLAHMPQTAAKTDSLWTLPTASGAPNWAQAREWIQVWLGVSPQEWGALQTQVGGWEKRLQVQLLAWLKGDPFTAAWQFLGASAGLFYLAEKGQNPRIQTYTDAFYYISTCASVGYADIFPVTQKGKAVASLVMTLGPAIAAGLLEG